MSNEERILLSRLSLGEFDGQVGNDYINEGGSIIWTFIEDGIPERFKLGPTQKHFDGKENERRAGAFHILKKWETDEEKIDFLRKFGWLMEDEDVRAYSAKFKPEKHR